MPEIQNKLIPLTYAEARAVASAGPFSFTDSTGLRVTRLVIGISDVITAANCVAVDGTCLLVSAFPCPLVSRRAA